MALTDKQQLFVEEYLSTWNATEAARRAGYTHPNVQGPRLLVNVGIEEEIKARLAEKVMAADEVLVRLSEQGRAAYSQYFMPNGTVNLPQIITDGKGHLIKSIKETKYGTNVEFYDAHAARELMGKHYGLFTDKVEHSGSVDLVVKGYVSITPDDWDADKDSTDSNL